MADEQSKNGVELQVRAVPEPRTAYEKADVFQVCRLGEAYAVSCYQFDYQTIASWAQLQPRPEEPPPAYLVARLVMDPDGFRRLRDEVNRIAELSGL